MIYTLLAYDRALGKLLHDESFDSRTEALQARFRLERERDQYDKKVEIVVLTSSSREDLMRTHSRYFRSLTELAHDAKGDDKMTNEHE